MVEDGDAGDNGTGGGFTKGIEKCRFEQAFGWIPEHCMIDQKSMHMGHYMTVHSGLMQACIH
jgi:hypothetical protein